MPQQSRVKESIEFVTETQELKQSIAALDIAIQREDWEAATRYMQRATTNVSPEVLNSGFAEAVVVSDGVHGREPVEHLLMRMRGPFDTADFGSTTITAHDDCLFACDFAHDLHRCIQDSSCCTRYHKYQSILQAVSYDWGR